MNVVKWPVSGTVHFTRIRRKNSCSDKIIMWPLKQRASPAGGSQRLHSTREAQLVLGSVEGAGGGERTKFTEQEVVLAGSH